MDKSIVPVSQIAARSSTGYEFSNSNEAEVVEIEDEDTSVGTVEKQMEDLKLNHQFNEKDVPQVFQDIMKEKMEKLKEIKLTVQHQSYTIKFDGIEIHVEKKGNDWLITYENIKKTVKTDDPEKSIIDHFWFVLKNPIVKLRKFRIEDFKNPKLGLFYQNQSVPKIDFDKLNTLLKSMIDSIDHQIHIEIFSCEEINISIFLPILKHLKPGTLEGIEFNISWKDEPNDQKMKEIIGTEQWKQAKRICSAKHIPPLKIEDLLHCEVFMLKFEVITPADVIQARELFINSTNNRFCFLFFENENLDFNAFREVLVPNSLSEKRLKIEILDCIVFTYELPNSPNCLEVWLNEYNIGFEKKTN